MHLAALVLALVLLAAPLAASAQQPPGKSARIGLLGDVPSFLDEAFRQGLRELGYVEGQNIAIEHRSPEWKYERLPGLAADLVRLKTGDQPQDCEDARPNDPSVTLATRGSGHRVIEGERPHIERE